MFAPRGWLSRRFHRQAYQKLAQSELFDRTYYRTQHLQGISKIQDPLWHFVTTGWQAGLSPSARFDTEYYLMKNDDVRVAQLNPLFHYAEYGQAERRLPVRSSLEAQHVATPEATPLRYFITPSLGRKRLSVLFDSATKIGDSESLRQMMGLAFEKAENESSSLRILYRDGALRDFAMDAILENLPAGLQDSIEVTNVPTTLTYSDIPFFREEISIATSWSSSLALRYTTERAQSFSIGNSGKGTSLVANNDSLRRSLVDENASVPEKLPHQLLARLKNSGPSDKPGVIAYVDIGEFPLAYSVILDALGGLILTLKPEVVAPAVTLVGNPGPRFAFAEELQPRLLSLKEFMQVDVTATCLVIMSDAADESASALATAGFRVIHSTPHNLEHESVEYVSKGALIRTSVTSESIQRALAKVLS
jgi:hypothetical protein